jgi:hypothetical protein
VLDVVDGLVEELGDVVVVEAVDDASALTATGDQAEGAQEQKLVAATESAVASSRRAAELDFQGGGGRRGRVGPQ